MTSIQALPSLVAIHVESRDPMRGSVEGGLGRSEGFVGWLALLAALERVFGESPGALPPREPLQPAHNGTTDKTWSY